MSNFNPADFTEATFEAALARAVLWAFPALQSQDIKHQTSFTLKIGHSRHTINGGLSSWIKGRSDILLTHQGRPLAIIELKRPGLEITDDDRQQGLSYARLLQPMAPLVVVSNGDHSSIYETYSGNFWKPLDADATSLESLLRNTTKAATADIRHAVEALLGTDPKLWVTAVRQLTRSRIHDLTGPWDDLLLPFPSDLVFPRKATAIIHRVLCDSEQIPVLRGPPLAGKSNVLREFAERCDQSEDEDFVVLLLDSATSGYGIFQTLANLLSRLFSIQFTNDQVRSWLRALSHSNDRPRLVLAIDGVQDRVLKDELDEFLSNDFGPWARVLLAVDDGEFRQMFFNSNGRHKTATGNRMAIIPVGRLDDEEFAVAEHILHAHRFVLNMGSNRAFEYRVPWLIRSIIGHKSLGLKSQEADVAVALPSVPGWEPFDYAIERFQSDPDLIGAHGSIADAVLRLIDEETGSGDVTLISMNAYACRPRDLAVLLPDAEIEQLQKRGYLKTTLLEDGERLYIAQLPHLVGAMLSLKLARRLLEESRLDEQEAAADFVCRAANLYLGEVVGARSLLVLAQKGDLPGFILDYLMAHPPITVVMPLGVKGEFLFNGERHVLEIDEAGKKFLHRPNGERVFLSDHDTGSEDSAKTHSDVTPWLILSHFACLPLGTDRISIDSIQERVDIGILLAVGKCPFVLRRPEGDGPESVMSHCIGDDVIVCHKEGIIEAITLSIQRAMLQNQNIGEHLVKEAIKSKSLPLLSRTRIALEAIEKNANQKIASWARLQRNEEVLPALQGTLLDHA